MTTERAVGTPWDNPVWLEDDTPWCRGLRWLQGWWRTNRLDAPPGPHAVSKPDGLVNSTLPAEERFKRSNFLTDSAANAADNRLAQTGSGGIVNEDRLRRNLLSSQPLCFNLFGHFQRQPDALLWWVRSIGCDAEEITRIEVEWAPPREEHFDGGSAFDAFVEYRRPDEQLGFVGVECKYAEHLPKSDVKSVREPYLEFTRSSGHWLKGAEKRLDTQGLRQFWLNTLLAQSLADTDTYAEGRCVVAACAADESAKAALGRVRVELTNPLDLTWHPYEEIIGCVVGLEHAEWKALFVERYLDFSPVVELLAPDDPRRVSPNRTEHSRLATAFAVAERVLGDGSVLARLADSDEVPGAAGVWHQLDTLVDDLKRLRVSAGRLLGDLDIE